MAQQSFESPLSTTAAPATEMGPILECSPQSADTARPALRVRARRFYVASAADVFAAWTNRMAWENWMRLRARSRAAIAPYAGGAFRLELAEGPTIHVVTGIFVEYRAPDRLKLVWQHHNAADEPSTIDVAIGPRLDGTELTFTHTDIGSRREAAWLMRLWTVVFRRLDDYLAGSSARPFSGPRRPGLRLVGTALASVRPNRPASSRA